MDDYDRQVAETHTHNAHFYEQFAAWMAPTRLSARAIQTHSENAQLFADEYVEAAEAYDAGLFSD